MWSKWEMSSLKGGNREKKLDCEKEVGLDIDPNLGKALGLIEDNNEENGMKNDKNVILQLVKRHLLALENAANILRRIV